MSVTLQDALAVALVPHALLAEGLSCFVFLFVQICNSWILVELIQTLYESPASQLGWTFVLCQTSMVATAHGPGAEHWDHLQQQWQECCSLHLLRDSMQNRPQIMNTIIFRANLVNSTWSKGKDPNADLGWGHVAPGGSNISKTPKPQHLSTGSASFPCLQPLLPPHPGSHKPSGYPHCQCQGLLTQSNKNGWNITRNCQTNLSLHTPNRNQRQNSSACTSSPADSSGWAGSAGKAGGFSLEEYLFRSALKPKQYFNRKQFLFLPRALTKLNLYCLELWTVFQLTKLQFLRPQQHQGTLPGGSQRGMFQQHYRLFTADIRFHWQHPLESSTSLIAAKWQSCFPH